MNQKEKIDLAKKVLNDIINSCVHPLVAVRVVMYPLAPIRECLKELEKEIDNK